MQMAVDKYENFGIEEEIRDAEDFISQAPSRTAPHNNSRKVNLRKG